MKNDGNMLKLRPHIIASAILSVLSCNSVDDKWNSLDTDVLKASFEVCPDVDMTWPVEAQVKLSSSDFSFKIDSILYPSNSCLPSFVFKCASLLIRVIFLHKSC